MTSKRNPRSRNGLRFAVVGLGHIAQGAVLPAFKHARNKVTLSALVSDDPLKLKKLGRQYRVANLYSYDEYVDCLRSGEIDAVYIALPNHLHCEYAVQALQMGIHVLCEKPLAVSSAECDRMIQAAESSGAKLMTAYRLHFDEANLKAIATANSKLGELRYFNSSFSHQVRDRENIRLEKKEGGGPIWDLGIYCLNAARYFFRAEPTEVFAKSGTLRGDSRFSEVDEMTSVTLKFPNERLATFVCSFGSAAVSSYEVVGTKGSLRLQAAYNYNQPRELEISIGDKKTKKRFAKVDQFAPQLAYFSDCVRTGRDIEPSGEEGLADIRVIEAVMESIRTGRSVKLKTPAKLARKPRPRLTQMRRKPPVTKPDLVHARPET